MSPNETAVTPGGQQDWLTRLNAFLNSASAASTRTPVAPNVMNPLVPTGGFAQPTSGANMAEMAQAGSFSQFGKSAAQNIAPAGKEEAFGNIGQQFAERLPRTAASIVAGPEAVVADMGVGGYGSAKEAGASDGQALMQGAISAAVGRFLPAATELGSSVSAQFLAKSPVVNETAQRVAEFLGGQVAAGGLMEGQRQASSVLAGNGLQNPLTSEHAFETALSTLPFAVAQGAREMAPQYRVGPDGVVDLPMTRTQEFRAANALARKNAPAPAEQNLIEGPPEPDFYKPGEQNVTPPPDANTDFPTGLRDLFSPKGKASEEAHAEFEQAAGLDSIDEPAQPVAQVEASLAKNYPAPDVVGESGPKAPMMQVDFGDPKQVTPTLLLDKLLAGEITPMGGPNSADHVALVEDLKRAFVTEPASQGQTFVNMDKVLKSANLAQSVLSGTVDPEQAKLWESFTPAVKTASIAAAKILQDPYAVLGKNPITGGLPEDKWAVQAGPDSYLRTVHNSAGALYAKWQETPVATATDAGTLVRDVNYFVKNVKDGLEQNGFGGEALKQLEADGGLAPVTIEGIQQKYGEYLSEFLNITDAEVAARTLQTVKNKILLAAQAAKESMLKSPKYQENNLAPSPKATRIAKQDAKLDEKFQEAVSKLPEEQQTLLNKLYTEYRDEIQSKDKGEARWRLDNFRDAVISGNPPLTPSAQAGIKYTRVLDSRMGGFKPSSLDASLEKTVGDKEAQAEMAETSADDESVEPTEAALAEKLGKTEEKVDPGADMSLVSKYFDGTPRDPEEVMNAMKPLEFEVAVDSLGKNKYSKIISTVAMAKNQTYHVFNTSGNGARWLKSFLLADYAGDHSPMRSEFAKENGWDLQKMDWAQQRRSILGRDEAKITWLKGLMMGLTPKAGLTPDTLLAASKKEQAVPRRTAKLAKFQYDVREVYTKFFLERGYQPELAASLVGTLMKVTKNFAGLDNAEFAMLTDRENTAATFMKDMTALGVHVPLYSTIDGKPVLNSIIAVVMKDYIDHHSYAAFNGFLKIATIAHEQYHAFTTNVVDNPAFKDANADTKAQIEVVKQMRKFSTQLSPEDRVRVASTLIDAMVPTKYTRGPDGKFRPEVKGLILGATRSPEEFVAFYYQMVATGLASKIATSEGKQGVAQSPRVTNDIRDAMMWLTKDEQSFIRGQFRHLGDMMQALQQTLDDPAYRESQGYVTTEEESRTVTPHEGAGPTKLQTSAQGQTTEAITPGNETSMKVKTKYTRPPTAGVGTTAVEMVKAAEALAKGQAGTPSARVDAIAKSPTHYQAVRKLAEIDLRVAKAEAMLQNLDLNLNTPDVNEAIANGEVKSIDVSDLPPIKDFMFGWLKGKQVSNDPVEIANKGWNGKLPHQQYKYHEGFFKQWFAPFQYRTADLGARGLKTAELARLNLSDAQPVAHLLNHAILDGITSRFGNFQDVRVDTTKQFFQFVNNGEETDPAARKALNNIIAKQQILKGVPVTDQTLAGFIQQQMSTVAPHKRHLVSTAVQTINDAYAKIKEIKFKSAVETQRNIIARLAMTINPGKLTVADAKMLGMQAIQISESGDLAARMTWMNSLVQAGVELRTANALLDIAANGWGYLQEYKRQMDMLGSFASESRVGPFLLKYKDPKGKPATIGILNDAEGKETWANLIRQGATDITKVDLRQRTDDALSLNDEAAQKVSELSEQVFKRQLEMVDQIDPDLGDIIRESYSPAVEFAKQSAATAVQKTGLKRRFIRGRETIDYMETLLDQAQKISTAIARRGVRQNHALYTTELRQGGHKEIVQTLDKSLQEVMAPSSPTVDKIKAAVVAKYLVKPASFIVEGMQMLSTGNGMMFKEGLPAKEIASVWNDSIRRGMDWKFSKNGQFANMATIGEKIEAIRDTGQMPIENKEASIAFALRRMNDEGRLGLDPLLDTNGVEDTLKVNLARATKNSNFKWEDTLPLMGNGLYQASKWALRMYGIMPRMNNWLSAGAALEIGYRKGLRGDALQSYALGLKDRMAVAGGRENKPEFVTQMATNKVARPAIALASLMSSYGLGMITMLASSTKEAIVGAPGLTPQQRVTSLKTAGYMLGVQLALAGGLGLPGVGAMIYVADNIFHQKTELHIREFWKDSAKFLGMDDAIANTVSDTAMNGGFNTLTGADFASRTGVGNIFGVNGYNGFDPAGLLGPIGGVAQSGFKGARALSGGNFGQAATELAPDGLKDLVGMFRNLYSYGDNRQLDTNGNLIMTPSTKENAMMALGFSPHSVRASKQKGRLIANSNKQYSEAHDQEMDRLAATIVNREPDAIKKVLSFGFEQRNNPGFDGKEYVRSIIDRTINMVFPRDATANGPTGNQAEVSRIGALFNDKQISEVKRLQAKYQLIQMFKAVGNPWEIEEPSDEEIDKASFVDQAMVTKGLTRQQALEYYEKMEGNK